MAESSTAKKEDSVEETSSSEEWTIIDNKDSKLTDSPEIKKSKSDLNEPKETKVTEEACDSKESEEKEVENLEEGEEAGEKEEIESDDVSVLSEESETEQADHEEGIVNRIERIDWQVERKSSEQYGSLVPKSSTDGGFGSSVLILCSVAALILGVILAGQLSDMGVNKSDVTSNPEMKQKLKELSGIEEKLKELKDVKQALELIQVNMPELKKLKDQLAFKKYEKDKYKHSVEDYKNLEKLSIQNIMNLNVNGDRLEMLEAAYQNFCLTITKINSSDTETENELCKTPKVLSDMISFKKNLKRAFEKTQDTLTPDKRMFIDAENKLDSMSESLLSELSLVFTKFSLKIHEKLNKFGYKLQKRLCLLNNRGESVDEFLNTLLDSEYFMNYCNETAEPIIVDSKFNTTPTKNSHHKVEKRSFEETKKNGYKNYNKNVNKNYQKTEHSNEESSAEVEYNPEFIGAKKKGEYKNESNWRKTKNEKEKYNKDEKKFNKYEKSENYKQEREYEENNPEFEIDKTSENISQGKEYHKKYDDYRKEDKYEKLETEKNTRDFDRKSDRKYEEKSNKYDRKSDYKFEDGNNRNFERKSDRFKSDFKSDFDKKPEIKKDSDFDRRFEQKEKDFEREFKQNFKYRDSDRKSDRKKNYDYDAKFIIDLEDDSEEFEHEERGSEKYGGKRDFILRPEEPVRPFEGKQKYENKKEYLSKPESYKESKYSKYDANERRDRKDKYQPDSDWQMQRGEAREKLRNSDWYFVRADSRKRARIVGDDEEEEEEEEVVEDWMRRPMPPQRNKPLKDSERGKDSFRKRVMKKVGRTWDFLNKEFRNYF